MGQLVVLESGLGVAKVALAVGDRQVGGADGGRRGDGCGGGEALALQLQGLHGTPLAQEGAGEAEQGSGPQGRWRLALQAGHQGCKQLGGLIGVTEQLQGLGLVQGAVQRGGRITRQPV